MADLKKVVYSLSNGAIFNDLEQPQPSFQGTPFFDAGYLTNS